jgi:hypothetical protein
MKCLIFSYDLERLVEEAGFYKTVTADLPLISPNRVVYYLMCLQALLEVGERIAISLNVYTYTTEQ